jgi:hypothetical protein
VTIGVKRAAKSKDRIDAAIVVELGAGRVSPAKLPCYTKMTR